MTQDYLIPENWTDVRLKDYLRFYNALKPYEGTEEYADKFLDRASLYLCNIPSDILRKMHANQFEEVSKTIKQLFSDITDMPLIKHFEIGETKYGFIPNLEEISYGEYIDLVSYSKDTWNNIAIIMSILYRPISNTHWSGKYDIQTYKGTNEDIVELFAEKLTMDIVFGAHSFFHHGLLELLRDIAVSTKKNLKAHKNNTQLKVALQANGLCLERLLQSLEEMPSVLMQQQK